MTCKKIMILSVILAEKGLHFASGNGVWFRFKERYTDVEHSADFFSIGDDRGGGSDFLFFAACIVTDEEVVGGFG